MLKKFMGLKRLWSGILATVLIIATFVPLQATAIQLNQNISVSITNATGTQGDIVSVPVAIETPTTAIASYDMEFQFDKSKMQIIEITSEHGTSRNNCGNDEKGCFLSNINNTEGWLKTIWVEGTHPITTAITLFTIKLQLKSDAIPGTTKIEVNTAQQGNFSFADDQGRVISPVVFSGGTQTIYEKPEPAPPSNVRVVPVVLDDGTEAAKVEIVRSIAKDGTKTDSISFNLQKANETIEQAVKANKNTATIVADEPEKDKADVVEVGINKEAVSQLSKSDINIKIQSEKASVELPIETVKQLGAKGEDLYFRMLEVMDPSSQKKTEDLVKQFSPLAQLVSQPVEVDTNFKGRSKVIVPFDQTSLPKDKEQLIEYINKLAVHIQHSDGEIKVDKGEVVYGKEGTPTHMAVWVEKFSTFTIIGTGTPQKAKEIGYVQVLKRINLWKRDEFDKLHYNKTLNPGEMYKVYSTDQLYGGQYAIGGSYWITNLNDYVSYRSVAQYAAAASVFPKGPKNEIGYVTVTKPINIWKREQSGKLSFVRVLKKGETYRAYKSDQKHGGQYNVGGSYWITQKWDHINFRAYKAKK